MPFDNSYPNRKDHRRPYFRAARFDRTCRPGGSCPWCKRNRLHNSQRRAAAANEQIRSFEND